MSVDLQPQEVSAAKLEKREYDKVYREAHRDRIREYQKRYRTENKEALAVSKKQYTASNAEAISAGKRRWKLANQDRVRKHAAEYYHLNKERILEKQRQYSKSHLEHIKERAKRYRASRPEYGRLEYRRRFARDPEKCRRTRRETQRRIMATPKGNIDHRMSKGIRRSLKGSKARRSWESLVGYTAYELEKHIERLFTPGMTWERFLNGDIEIDHAIPKSKFHYSHPEDIQFKRCWALENLQPRWKQDNRKKFNHFEKHEQIALGI